MNLFCELIQNIQITGMKESKDQPAINTIQNITILLGVIKNERFDWF